MPASAKAPVAGAHPSELRVLLADLPGPGERPLPSEDEVETIRWIDPRLDDDVREHVAPHLGTGDSTSRDWVGPIVIDVATLEPDGRRWGACVSIGASVRAMPMSRADRRRAPAYVEFFARLPESLYRYWDGVILDQEGADVRQAAETIVADLGKVPQELGVHFRAPQLVGRRDFTPISPHLPFAGVLLRDGAAGPVRVPPMRRRRGGSVHFLSVTFLFPSEVKALAGPAASRVLARLADAGVDDLMDLDRPPVV